MKLLILALALLVVFVSATANVSLAFSEREVDFRPGGRYNPSVRQNTISAGIFTCSSSEPIVKNVCGAVFSIVDEKLRTKSLLIQRNSLLVNYIDPNHYGIPTGHSCSITAQRRYTLLQARINTQNSIKLSGDILNKPAVVAIRLPVHLHGRIDVRYRFGARLFGKCRRYGRDSATASGDIHTVADGTVAVSLKPSFRRRTDGNYEITIEPRVALLFNLENTNLRLKLRGQSRFTKFWIAIKGFFAGKLRIIADIFKGRSLKDIFKGIVDRLKLKLGHILVLTYFDLPSGLRGLVESELASPYLERLANKKANKMLDDQEDKLNREIRKLLGTDSNGKLTYVISHSTFRLITTVANSVTSYSKAGRRSGSRGGTSRGTTHRGGSNNRRIYRRFSRRV